MKPATWKNLPIQAPLNVHLWIAVSCICRQWTAKYIHFSWCRSGQVISIIRGEQAIHMVMWCGVNGSCGVKFVSGVELAAWGHCATAAGQGLSLSPSVFSPSLSLSCALTLRIPSVNVKVLGGGQHMDSRY